MLEWIINEQEDGRRMSVDEIATLGWGKDLVNKVIKLRVSGG
jgi:hypothetical protein